MKSLIFAILLVSLAACQKTETVTNKATCLQAQEAIKNAQYQQKIIEQQLVLAAVSEAEEKDAESKRKELKAAILIFGRIVEDPNLNCSQYLK